MRQERLSTHHSKRDSRDYALDMSPAPLILRNLLVLVTQARMVDLGPYPCFIQSVAHIPALNSTQFHPPFTLTETEHTLSFMRQ